MGSIGSMFSKARDAVSRLVWGGPRATVYVAGATCPDPRDRSVPENIITYPGDEVVCDGPEQHVIARALFTIEKGDDASKCTEQFCWFQAPPALGTPILDIKCAHCDGRWVSSMMHLHFKGGWR